MKIIQRTFVISDIHGELNKFINLLEKIKYDPAKDQLILLGDYIDRGLKSKETIDYILQLKEKSNNLITLIGNHESMFLNWLDTNDYDYKDVFFHNGGLQTIESYVGLNWFENGIYRTNLDEAKHFIKSNYIHHIQFLKELVYYHEQDQYIFIHAGINPNYEDWKMTPKHDMIWIRNEFIKTKINNTNKTIIFGHTPTINIHGKADIWFEDNKIGIDGGSVFGCGCQLNCLEIVPEYGYRQFSYPN